MKGKVKGGKKVSDGKGVTWTRGAEKGRKMRRKIKKEKYMKK